MGHGLTKDDVLDMINAYIQLREDECQNVKVSEKSIFLNKRATHQR
jgi:hypothetical protein